jgi:hypothetical protein
MITLACMRSEKDVEAYLLRLNRRFTAVDDQPGTFLVHTTNGMPAAAVRVDPPIVVVRVHIGDVSKENAELYRRLLELNAKSLVHSSYGLEGERIILSSALELENLDFNELQAALDEIDVALTQQVPSLAALNKGDKK